MVLLIYPAGWMIVRKTRFGRAPGCFWFFRYAKHWVPFSSLRRMIRLACARPMAYTDCAPLLPVFGTGILPIAQMLVLPPLIFRIVGVASAKR
jgi:hypothetical protein